MNIRCMLKRGGIMSDIKSLKLASTIASLGNILGGTKTKAEEIAWKKRMLKTQQGLSFPADFDSLPEDEQLKRLDGVINVGLDKDNK